MGWGFKLTVLIFYKSGLGLTFCPGLKMAKMRDSHAKCVGLGGSDLWGFISPKVFMGIYITQGLSINPHKSFQFSLD